MLAPAAARWVRVVLAAAWWVLLPLPPAHRLLHWLLPLCAACAALCAALPQAGGQLGAALPAAAPPAGQVPAAALLRVRRAAGLAQRAARLPWQRLPPQPESQPPALKAQRAACRHPHLPCHPDACCLGEQAWPQPAGCCVLRHRHSGLGFRRFSQAGQPGSCCRSLCRPATAVGGQRAAAVGGSGGPPVSAAILLGHSRRCKAAASGSGAHQSEAEVRGLRCLQAQLRQRYRLRRPVISDRRSELKAGSSGSVRSNTWRWQLRMPLHGACPVDLPA